MAERSDFNPTLFNTAEAGLLQAQAYRNLRKFLIGHLKQFGLSTPEWAVMGLLYRAEAGLTPSKLAAAMSVSLPQVTVIVNKLYDKSLIERITSPGDRRVKTIKLTLKGRRFFTENEATLRKHMRVFLSDVEDQELATYIHVLYKLAKKY